MSVETMPNLVRTHWTRVLHRDLLAHEPNLDSEKLHASVEVPKMSELLSRMLLSTEAILISFPLTAFFISEEFPTQWHRALDHPTPASWLSLSACLVLIGYAACIWRLIVAFSVNGNAALRLLFTNWWYVPHAAATVAVTILMFASAAFTIDPAWLRELLWALPMAVPSAHLGIEYSLRSNSRGNAAGAIASRDGGRPGVSLKLVR
jgi:hypothetical protein